MPRTTPKPAAPKGLPSTMPPPPPPGQAGRAERPARALTRREGSPAAGPAEAPTGKPRGGGWLAGFAGRLRDAAEALGPGRGGRRVHEFADLVASAREPDRVESALVALAGELADAYRVELLVDRDEASHPDPRRVAVWPEASAAMTAAEVEALGYPLCLGLWCGDHYQMTLQLYARPGRGGRWPKRVVRRLTTLCAMAAAAERGLHADRRGRVETPAEASAAVRDATFLNAILPYALSQAQRHREPLTVFCVEVEHLGALRRSHGPDAACLAVRRVAEAVARTLRGSDVVARLDDDRVAVVLPNTGSADALTVAEVVRSAAAAACLPAGDVPGLSASVGVACFPDDASDMAGMLSAADEAVGRARAVGPNRVAAYATPRAAGGG